MLKDVCKFNRLVVWFCISGSSVLLMMVMYSRLEVWVVCVLRLCSVMLKRVGNMMELYRFMVSNVYIVIGFCVVMLMVMRFIVSVVCMVSSRFGVIMCMMVILMKCFIMVLF